MEEHHQKVAKRQSLIELKNSPRGSAGLRKQQGEQYKTGKQARGSGLNGRKVNTYSMLTPGHL